MRLLFLFVIICSLPITFLSCSKGVCTDDTLQLELNDFNISPSDTVQISQFALTASEILINTQYYHCSPINESSASVYAINNAKPNPSNGYFIRILHSNAVYVINGITLTDEKCGHGDNTYKAIDRYAVNGTIQTGHRVIIHR